MANKKTLSQKIKELPTEKRTEKLSETCVTPNREVTRKAAKNGNLHKAKEAKSDEYYTRLEDIEAEMMHYRQHFKDKIVFCNCDDPEWSNFFRYFAINFSFLGLKKLISTHYNPNGNSYALIVDKNLDVNGDGTIDIKDTLKVELTGNGDFNSAECIKYLMESDIVVSNPPFSLFREYIEVLIKNKKKFLIIGNKNAITYKEVFKHIKDNKLWIGMAPLGKDWLFSIPTEHEKEFIEKKKEGSAYRIVNGKILARVQACWFTNLPNKKRNTPLDLVGSEYSPEKYPKYDNADAIEVSKVSDIPDGYKGVMGVPISFLDKYCPEQFEIVKFRKGDDGKDLSVNGVCPYFRILIRAK